MHNNANKLFWILSTTTNTNSQTDTTINMRGAWYKANSLWDAALKGYQKFVIVLVKKNSISDM